MNAKSSDLSLSADQMRRVVDCVAEEAKKTRVAASFLPRFEADPAAIGLPNLQLGTYVVPPPPGAMASGTEERIVTDHTPDLFVTTLTANVSLAAGELWDPNLVAALPKFRRVASLIARAEDALVFSGQAGAFALPPAIAPGLPLAAASLAFPPGVVQVLEGGSGLQPDNGLLPALSYWNPGAFPVGGRCGVTGVFVAPQTILPGVVAAITALEGSGHSGPFACVLSPDAYTLACTSDPVLPDLPRDLVTRVLEGGPLLRSSMVAQGYGVMVALGQGLVELVVARDITVDELQISEERRAIFTVSERVALRIKDLGAIAVLFTP